MKNIIKIASFSAIALLTTMNANAKTNSKAEKFILDPLHTNIIWSANHVGFSNPNGKFAKSSGVMFLDETNPAKSSVKVEIDMSGIITGFEAFDKHLKTADFFNSEKFKTAKFISTKVEVLSKDTAKIHGKLTLLGVTKPVILEAKLNKIGEHPFTKKKTAGFSATTTIKRSEFGIKYGLPMVSDDVKLSVEVEGSVE
jgi:polyisoprenoid-binding protein YceI